MVLLHALRCLRYARRGAADRNHALATFTRGNYFQDQNKESTLLRPDLVSKAFSLYNAPLSFSTPVYCGLRMADMFGHVNNAKYLEILEFGRWYSLSFTGMGPFMRKNGIVFVVSDLSIQYVREIKPFTTIHVTVQQIHSGNPKRMIMRQTIWNADRSAVHADAVMQVALLGSPMYAEALRSKYGVPTPIEGKVEDKDKKSKPLPSRVPLNCYEVLADSMGLDSIAPLEEGLSKAASTSDTPSATASSSSDWMSEIASGMKKWRGQIHSRRFTM